MLDSTVVCRRALGCEWGEQLRDSLVVVGCPKYLLIPAARPIPPHRRCLLEAWARYKRLPILVARGEPVRLDAHPHWLALR